MARGFSTSESARGDPADKPSRQARETKYNGLARVLIIVSVVQTINLTLPGGGFALDRLSLFGNTLELGGPVRLAPYLWAAWVYFLLRSIQYRRLVARSLISKKFRAIYFGRLRASAGEAALAEAIKGYRQMILRDVPETTNEDFRLVGGEDYHLVHVERKGINSRGVFEFHARSSHVRANLADHVNAANRAIGAKTAFAVPSALMDGWGGGSEAVFVRAQWRLRARAAFRGVCELVVLNFEFFEFALPFMVAGLPVLVLLYTYLIAVLQRLA